MQRKQRPYIRINISENVTYDDRTKVKHVSHKKNADKYKGTKHHIIMPCYSYFDALGVLGGTH